MLTNMFLFRSRPSSTEVNQIYLACQLKIQARFTEQHGFHLTSFHIGMCENDHLKYITYMNVLFFFLCSLESKTPVSK